MAPVGVCPTGQSPRYIYYCYARTCSVFSLYSWSIIILLPEVEGSGAFNCVTERIRTGRNVAIKNVDRKTRLF